MFKGFTALSDGPVAATALPEPVCLGDEHYSCTVMPDGRSLSRYGDWWLHPWSDDPLTAGDGVCVYIRDVHSHRAVALAGTRLDGQSVPVALNAQARSVDYAVESDRLHAQMRLEVDSALHTERRVIQIAHHDAVEREFEITVAMEVALAKGADFRAHPAFSKLFVQTQFDPQSRALSATRRARQPSERHSRLVLSIDGPVHGYETDRVKFIGRGRDLADPVGLTRTLSGSVGNVLDPILVLRTRVNVPARGSRTITAVLQWQLPAPAGTRPPDADPFVSAPLSEFNPSARRALTAQQQRELYFTLRYWRHPPSWPAPLFARDDAAMAAVSEAPADAFQAGAFSDDHSEYRLRLTRNRAGYWQTPPMPWCNVIANGSIGVIVSERGGLSTMGVNSRLYRLTPWSNDPVTDPLAEWLYLKDVQSGQVTSLLPGLNTNADQFNVTHGFGYSQFDTEVDGIKARVEIGVAHTSAVRLIHLTLVNPSDRARHFKVVGGHRWVLGGESAQTHPFLHAVRHRSAIGVQTSEEGGFQGRCALWGLVGAPTVFKTDDVFGFWGRRYDVPQALKITDGLKELTGRFERQPQTQNSATTERDLGYVANTAAIVGTALTLSAHETRSLTLVLVDGDSVEQAQTLWDQFDAPEPIGVERQLSKRDWQRRVRSTTVRTPDANLDPMLNGWLRYQTLSCRLLGRSAYYQSGGAYGFRDQLQDAAALAQDDPSVLRQQLILNARHQFQEGDVLHWWHHPLSVGIRTKFADDLVWLPYLLSYYLTLTGDEAILDEPVPFVSARPLTDEEHEIYTTVTRTAESASLYQHAVLALVKACTSGEHGLPLFGCGDWNDGMNRVGVNGKGESVWMAFFLYRTLQDFLPIMRLRQDPEVARLEPWLERYRRAVHEQAWDGEWFRRGYYDNGAPLGSKHSDECQIDALAQAWSVISGITDQAHQSAALQSMVDRLVDLDHGLIRLLTPAFEDTPQDPGYIKGYVAGIRENGGQYTHAALWVVKALLMANRRSLAAACLSRCSPLWHTRSPESIERYKVEPFVIAADVYGCEPHVGRGGWTWYTGSSGWMLRVAIEDLLGFRIEKNRFLIIDPKIPDHWPEASVVHTRPNGQRIEVRICNDRGVAEAVTALTVNGHAVPVGPIDLSPGTALTVLVHLGPKP